MQCKLDVLASYSTTDSLLPYSTNLWGNSSLFAHIYNILLYCLLHNPMNIIRDLSENQIQYILYVITKSILLDP